MKIWATHPQTAACQRQACCANSARFRRTFSSTNPGYMHFVGVGLEISRHLWGSVRVGIWGIPANPLQRHLSFLP